mgnify:CR=1 FL=1
MVYSHLIAGGKLSYVIRNLFITFFLCSNLFFLYDFIGGEGKILFDFTFSVIASLIVIFFVYYHALY